MRAHGRPPSWPEGWPICMNPCGSRRGQSAPSPDGARGAAPSPRCTSHACRQALEDRPFCVTLLAWTHTYRIPGVGAGMGAKRALIVDDLQVCTPISRSNTREIRDRCRQCGERGSGYRVSDQPPAGCDLHGSPHARHGRISGRPGHQEQSADRNDPHHDVHLTGGRAVPGTGPCAGSSGRAAEADQADGRVEGSVPVASAG